ncbi:MAG TPA: DNA repair protein RadA [Tepidisphaeraceae bacterium]|jgi:DNA repair protein RadA/Sms
MAKAKTHFLCNNCGSVQAKWFGKCPDCGMWDSLEQYKEPTIDKHRPSLGGSGLGASRADLTVADLANGAEALTLAEIDTTSIPRIPTGIGEFDRILGGGLVPGSATLVGGEPGIGKSTLLLQVAGLIGRGSGSVVRDSGSTSRTTNHEPRATTVMYVTSEESARQTKLRAERISLQSPSLRILAETNIERIRHQILKHKPDVVIVDSIQMIYKPDLPAAPGSVTQLRDGCMELVYLAKSTGTAVIVVGHVTKAGTLAGPKIIEHIVDTVVYFEGDRFHSHRIVRCVKNRFGSTHEVGVFEMTGDGLKEIADPAALFVHAHGQPTSGTILTAAMQGSRVMVLEVQALTASSVIGAARRKTSGVSNDRVAMILAVLEKRCELKLAAEDVFVNVAGGVKVIEPAIDLAVALAIASAHINRPIAPGTLALGELGLGGEVRPVPQLENRLKEASRLGASQSIIPPVGNSIPKLNGMALHEVRRVNQALAAL